MAKTKEYRITRDEALEIFDAISPYGINLKARDRFINEALKNSAVNVYLDSGQAMTVFFRPSGYFAEMTDANSYDAESLMTQRSLNAQLDVMYRKFEC